MSAQSSSAQLSSAPRALRFGRREIAVLGILSAIGPIGVDIYLPAFPTIARDLGTGVGAVQFSMAAYFLALALGQLPYGAMSDALGRKPPILFGLAVFVAGSLLCALAMEIEMLILGRFVQGLGICAILAVSRAIIRDRQTGQDAAHSAARILLIVSVSPMLAPLAGSAIIAVADWRLIFYGMALLGLLAWGLAWRILPETAGRSAGAGLAGRLAHCRELLGKRAFLLSTGVLAAAQAGASIYLAGTSSVYLLRYGLSPSQYSLVFALNAGGMIFAAQWNRRLVGRLGLANVIGLGTGLGTFTMAVFLLAELAGLASLPVAFACFFLFFAAFGFVMGPAAVLALEGEGQGAGIASGFQGTLQFVSGALAVMLCGGLADLGLAAMLGVLVVSQTAAFVLAQRCRRPAG